VSRSLLPLLGVLVSIAIPLASFVTGLRATEPLWLWKRPRLLGRSLFVILIVIPVITVLLLEVLAPGSVLVSAGITVSILAIGIGPPNLFKRTEAASDSTRYEVGLNVVLLPLAIVYLPLALALHGAVFHHDVRLPPSEVARVVLFQALLPFGAGMALARVFPQNLNATLEFYAGLFVKLAISVVVIVALAVAWRPLIGLGPHAWLTCAAVAMIAILIGHALGGPTPETRGVLAAFSAMRFPGLALLIVSAVPGGQVLIPVVLAYVITSAALVGAYRAAGIRPGRPEEAPAEPE